MLSAVRWSEPAVWREPPRGATIDPAALSLPGLEQIRAVTSRPAMSRLTGTTFDSAGPHTATFSMPATGWLLTSQGAIPGGMLAVPADGALGCAIQTDLPAGRGYTTAELSLTWLRPVRRGGRVTARALSRHVGRRLGFSACDITDASGALVAHATTRCSVFDLGGGTLSRSGTATPPPRTDADQGSTDDLPDPFERAVAGEVLDQSTWDTCDGLTVLREQIAGRLPWPPLHHLLGLMPIAVSEGSAECVMPLTGWLATPWGWPQGGFVAVLADAALATAVQTTVPAGTAFATVDLKVNFLRPVAGDGSLLHARATVVHRGRTLAVARAELSDEQGRRVAMATGSAQILAGRPAALTGPEDG